MFLQGAVCALSTKTGLVGTQADQAACKDVCKNKTTLEDTSGQNRYCPDLLYFCRSYA